MRTPCDGDDNSQTIGWFFGTLAKTAGMMDRAGDIASGLSRRPYERRVVVCNCASYCYFSLAIVLFSLGTVLTILVLDDSEKVFPNLTHMWLIGPIFISSGLMFAVKTIMYLRRETMLAYISRQHSLLRELHLVAVEPTFLSGVGRNMSAASLPPAYETVVGQSPACPLLEESTRGRSLVPAPTLPLAEQGPPSYEEAILLCRGQLPAVVRLQDSTFKDSETHIQADR